MGAAEILASAITAVIVLLVLGVFVWAAREDGRAERLRSLRRRPRQ